MNRAIWLRSGEQTWLEVATDEKGTLNISTIARRTKLLPETLLLGELGAYEGTTIRDVRIFCGSTAGQSEGSAVLVGGTAIPAGVLFLAVKYYKMFQYGFVDSAVRVVMNIRTCSLEADGFVRFRQDVGFAL